ncbi:MAG: hypothetical protein ACK5HU_03250 [Flavobacteriales bacterium]
MKSIIYSLVSIGLFLFTFQTILAQGSPNYHGGIKLKLNEDGSKYIRFISWVQVQGVYNNNVAEDENHINFNLRRARFLSYAQITDKFLILTHFGLNNLNNSTLTPTGKGDNSQLFFHDAWGQYQVAKNHTLGGGLHYFNGISRLNNQSTSKLLTLDGHRQSWATLGLSDQLARHIGVFAKGNFGKLQYRIAFNDAIKNGLDQRTPENGGSAVYGGTNLLGTKEAGRTFAGYFEYNLLDQESNFLPFKVGTYLGTKKILNIGAGFFSHPNGSVTADKHGNLKGDDVSIFAIDVFYDTPIGKNGSAITAYATYQNNDYGKDYLYNVYGTGSMIYGHLGYLIPGKNTKPRIQPYISYSNRNYDAINNNQSTFGIGSNLYLEAHHSKLTLEYKNEKLDSQNNSIITLQATIYL